MNINPAVVRLVLLFSSDARSVAERIDVVNMAASGRMAIVEFRFEHSAQPEISLLVNNPSKTPVLFGTDIHELSVSLFLDFPVAGALQLETNEKKPIEIGEEMPDGWWYPNTLNSVIVQPKFSVRQANSTQGLDDGLKPYLLAANGKEIIKINYQKALAFASELLKSREPSMVPANFRIGVKIRIAGATSGERHFISSDWIPIAQKSR